MTPHALSEDLAPERLRPLRRAEYEQLVAAGAFTDERVELLGGVIVEVSPQEPRHAAVIQRLDRAFQLAVGDRAQVRTQLPLAISNDSLPEPDLALVIPGRFDDAHPSTASLVVEVANRSVRKDRRIKAELYAAAGIAEYWLVNLQDDVIEVFSEPSGATYARIEPARPGAILRPKAFPDITISVAAVLGLAGTV